MLKKIFSAERVTNHNYNNTVSFVRPIRFRLTAPNWERPSPDYGSHIIMSINGISFTYIYIFHIHHLQVLSSIPCSRVNIFNISYHTESVLTYTSALVGSSGPTELFLTVHSRGPIYHYSPRRIFSNGPSSGGSVRCASVHV